VRRAPLAALSAVLCCALAGVSACRRDAAAVTPGGGDPARGRALVAHYQCGVCHAIPGVRGARGVVGPPLERFAQRSFVAGIAPNTPENAARWVRDPSAMAPETAMPTIGLDVHQSRDVAAFLHTLR
jgi:cytochrome c2